MAYQEEPSDLEKTPLGPRALFKPLPSPLVTFRLLFNVGAVNDPADKPGLAAMTAAMLARGGTSTSSYEQILRAMYPMATEFDSQVDKEMTVFFGTSHTDNLADYYRIISEMLLNPGWREDDFARLQNDAINFLRVNLRGTNDEELGKEALYNFIYDGHPYGRHTIGTIASLERLRIEDLKSFYADNYTQANLTIGISGGCPSEFVSAVEHQFSSALPQGRAVHVSLPAPPPIRGRELLIIQKDIPGTAISLGFPIAITRSSPEWPALLVAQSYFGQHRSSNSFLYQRLRQIRGLNYGDYAYIEYFPRGMFQFHPDPNLCRQQQIFQIWIRPVEPENALFSLRLALYELTNLVQKGMAAESFEATRRFLSKFVNILVKSQDDQLGYALDSRFYGIPEFDEFLKSELAKLTVHEVNRVIKKHLQAVNVKIVVVTADAEGFRRSIDSVRSPVTYATVPPKEILDEDRLIESYPLNVNDQTLTTLRADEMFES